MSLSAVVLMCHAPIVVPAVGGARGAACQATTEAMSAAARELVWSAPDVIVVVSPHAPRAARAWGVCFDGSERGSFARFGAPDCVVRLPGATDFARGLAIHFTRAGLDVFELPGSDLEHGATVPLYFVAQEGWSGPTLLMSLSSGGDERRLGELLGAYAEESGVSVGLLASGDMSHRLKPGAPGGFHPKARRFDAHIVERLTGADLAGAIDVDPTLRELAAEDVVGSLEVAFGALGSETSGCRFLEYEGPFGVGYAEAILYRNSSPRSSATGHVLAVARKAVGAVAHNADAARAASIVNEAPYGTTPSRGVFVTLRTRSGELRGCIGHIEPQRATLEDEVFACARAAASTDPRFAPVRVDELSDIRLEISLLTPPVPVPDATHLDPQRYGVLISGGERRGVLLPAIPGVDTVERQLQIARAKAHIAENEPIDLQRFEVIKLVESPL